MNKRRARTKPDVMKLLRKFVRGRLPKAGDLVLTGEIHRVVKQTQGNPGEKGKFVEVVTVWPPVCGPCNDAGRECIHSRIMNVSGGGQQGILVMKDEE